MMGWYSNGQVSVQGKYVDGKWTWWHENGQKKVEGTYDAGQQSSDWLQWDKGWQDYLYGVLLKREAPTETHRRKTRN